MEHKLSLSLSLKIIDCIYNFYLLAVVFMLSISSIYLHYMCICIHKYMQSFVSNKNAFLKNLAIRIVIILLKLSFNGNWSYMIFDIISNDNFKNYHYWNWASVEIKDHFVRKWKIQSLKLRNQQDRFRGKRSDESKNREMVRKQG